MFFFVKTQNPRPTFHLDMTPEEREIMQSHLAYMADFAANGTAIVYGPVLDPAGMYGIGVYEVADEAALQALLAGDPAKGLLQYQYFPMPRAVVGKPR
jgi:uncharacterized protein YciI